MERKGRGRRSKDVEQIARERIEILFAEAHNATSAGRRDRAKRYVVLARRLGMRYNVSLPGRYRRWVCGGCGAYLVPGVNSTARLRPRRFVISCKECGAVKRVGRKARKGKGARA